MVAVAPLPITHHLLFLLLFYRLAFVLLHHDHPYGQPVCVAGLMACITVKERGTCARGDWLLPDRGSREAYFATAGFGHIPIRPIPFGPTTISIWARSIWALQLGPSHLGPAFRPIPIGPILFGPMVVSDFTLSIY